MPAVPDDIPTSVGLRLDFGCGLSPTEGFIGVDLHTSTTDNGILPVDLFRPDSWPWEDGSVAEVFASHFVEHIPAPYWDPHRLGMRIPWCEFVDAVWRILTPGGTFSVVHPNLWSMRAFQDPTHTQFMPLERWLYTRKDWRVLQGLDHAPYPTADFHIVPETAGFAMLAQSFQGRAAEATDFALLHYVNVAGDINLQLRAIKDGWVPPDVEDVVVPSVNETGA
jgi:hypothetical protein